MTMTAFLNVQAAGPGLPTTSELDFQSSESAWQQASQLKSAEAILTDSWLFEPSSSNQTRESSPSQQEESSPPTLAQRLQRAASTVWKCLYAIYTDPVLRLIWFLCFLYPTVYQVVKLYWVITLVFLIVLRLFSIKMQRRENARAKLSGENPLQAGVFVCLSTVAGLCIGIFAERYSDDSVGLAWVSHFVWSEIFLLQFEDEIRKLWFPESRSFKDFFR